MNAKNIILSLLAAAVIAAAPAASIAANAEQGIEPDKTVLDAMLYNVAKHVGAMHVALEGKTAKFT